MQPEEDDVQFYSDHTAFSALGTNIGICADFLIDPLGLVSQFIYLCASINTV